MCADDNQLIGVRDPRTGEIRKRADWSIIREPSRRFQKLHARFYCSECWEEQEKADATPLLGIDKPPHASDFWRPSIIEHIRLTAIKNNHDTKMKEDALAMQAQSRGDGFTLERERQWTPAQRSQALFLGRRLRELGDLG